MTPSLRIYRVETLGQFQEFEDGIRDLLFLYKNVLLDDFSGGQAECLVENTITYIPWLWLLIDEAGQNYGVIALSDIIPGRHVYLHGVSDPSIRRHPILTEVSETVISIAFDHLQVMKIKIEIEASNKGAKGFCLRMGFIQEACFKRDIRIGGIWQDVLVYSLFRECFKSKIGSSVFKRSSDSGIVRD